MIRREVVSRFSGLKVETSLTVPMGSMALWKNGEVVYIGKLGDPIDDAECDTVMLPRTTMRVSSRPPAAATAVLLSLWPRARVGRVTLVAPHELPSPNERGCCYYCSSWPRES
jgi:hypothetical protein